MRKSWFAAAAVVAMASLSGAGVLGPGETAPMPEAKETIGLAKYDPKSLDGKVVYLEIFRTW